MNKIIYILPLIFSIFFASCEVEDSDSAYPRTAQARTAFDFVEKGISQSVDLLDLMTKVSYYSEAPDDKKEGIKNYFLSEYSIISTSDSWILEKSNSQEIIFTHNNKIINETGAIWTAKVTQKFWDGLFQTIVEDKNYKVESLSTKNWKISTVDFSFYGYYQYGLTTSGDLYVTGADSHEKSSSLYDFKVEKGSGITNANTAKLTYNILKSATYSTSRNYIGLVIINGEIEVASNNQKDKLRAEVLTSNYYYPQVKITYKGITETY